MALTWVHVCLGSSMLGRQREYVCVCVCVCRNLQGVSTTLSTGPGRCLWWHSCYKDGREGGLTSPEEGCPHLPGLQNSGCSDTQGPLHSGHAYWCSHRALLIGVGDTVIGAHVSDVGARSGILSFGSGKGEEICTQRAHCFALLMMEKDVFGNRVHH